MTIVDERGMLSYAWHRLTGGKTGRKEDKNREKINAKEATEAMLMPDKQRNKAGNKPG